MIGGNISATIQSYTSSKNSIGEYIKSWEDQINLFGFFDLMAGNANYSQNAKIAESTHLFICDYCDLTLIDIENSRLIVNDIAYDITWIDDPMFLHDHIEIYAKQAGVVNG